MTTEEQAGAPLDRLRALAKSLWRALVVTIGRCLTYRVSGLAAEAAFFALLSVPPLVFALTGAIGFVSERYPPAAVENLEQSILDLASKALTDDAVQGIIAPTIDEVLSQGRLDVMSIGFFLALWTGSRALNVFVDTITIMHGLGGERGIVRTRALSFGLYLMAMITGSVALPLVVLGPSLVDSWLPDSMDALHALYWPLVLALSACFLATLYHVAVPGRTGWSLNVPGAVLSLVVWIGGSWLLRLVLTVSEEESRSVFGPLAAPIAVLLWLYLVALAVLIGAALNSALDEVFQRRVTPGAATPEPTEAVAVTDSTP